MKRSDMLVFLLVFIHMELELQLGLGLIKNIRER